MKPRDRNRLPVPEVIDGKEWDVGESVGHHAGTNITGHEMFVPIDAECDQCGLDHARYIRCHELTHAKYSKGSIGANAEKADVSSESYQLAEENFIEAITTRSYPQLDPGLCKTKDGRIHEVRDVVSMAIKNGNVELAARLSIAAASGLTPLPDGPVGLTGTETQIYDAYRTFSEELRYETVNSRARYAEANIHAMAQKIERFLGQVDEAAEQDRRESEEEEKERKTKMKLTKEPRRPGGDDGTKFRKRRFARTLIYVNAYGKGGAPRWGSMTLQHPPRPINLNKKFGVRKYRASSEGARVRNISRFYSDQKVFGRKRKYRGGTLLVDASGSMSFSRTDLETIVQQIPAATVALYAGSSTTGICRIVVKGGTCVEAKQMATPGGNVVDGPALDWLGKQREPRIWLSDGGVCVDGASWDVGDLYGDAAKKCRKHNIRRVRWLEQAKKAFDDPTVGVRSPLPTEKVDTDGSEFAGEAKGYDYGFGEDEPEAYD